VKPQASARSRLLISVWFCAFTLLYAAMTHAQALSPEVSRGLSWLQSQVQLGGALANEGSSIATALQNRAEVAQTLKTLSTLPASLTDAIAGETEGNTEYLARRIVSLALVGRDVSALVAALSAYQNPDGGFGGGAGYDSNAIETAWALIAFKSVNAIAPVSPALAYLSSAQASDGSYSAPGRPDVEATAITVLAQRLYASEFNNVITTIQRAVAYLLAQQSPAQLWGDSAFLTSTAYEAVHDFVPLEPTATVVRGFLATRQESEGSWDNGDPFSTALALRALLLASTAPANPILAIVKGKVIDSQTGLALDGVIAALSGPATPAPAVTSAGLFEFRDLPPGAYGLQLSLSQYGTITTATNVSAGQTLNLGVLQMSKSAGAATGTVRGTVKDSTTNQPIANALVATSGGLSGLTDGTGNYQIANVPPGAITVQATKSGYANAGGAGSLSAGGVFVFSPALVPGAQTGAGAILLGIVTRSPDGVPLAGVSITVSGATSASAITDAQGSFRITGLNPGLTQVSATLAGFDSVSAATNVVANATVNFSPVLFASNTSPPNGNKASVTGVVMDSGTNAVLPAVSVSATFGTTTVPAQTGADGRFKFEGITTATVDLSFSLSGYGGSTVSVPLELLEALDIGQVRLRRSQVTQLLPDLAVKSLTRAGTTTDPQTLAASGQVTAVVANIGTAIAPAGVQVVAFHDANRNGVYDPGQDTLLGQVSLDFGLAPGAQATLLVPVSGSLPFRDAPIHIWLDSTQAAVEQNETNNIASTAAAAQVIPSIGTFAPVLKWAWTGVGSVLPEHNQVMSIPVVAPIEDTNGDGKIDEHDIPGVIFHTFVGGNIIADGVLRALSGRDGHELWTVTNSAFRTNPGGHLAVADLDGDGIVEIIAPKSGGGVIVFGHDGSFKWQSPVPANNVNSGALAVADLDGDGVPEIIFGNTVLNANGTLRWQGAGPVGVMSIVADLDLDGIPEVIAGGTAYRNNGQLYWQNNNLGGIGGQYVAIGNFDADPFPEIVIVNDGRVWLLEHDGTIKWGPVAIPGGGFGGPPTIADMDGDGVPEIGVAGASRYVVFRADGSILWTSPTSDFSSSSTGSSVFDFDGDGTAEVVYADERFLRVYNGKTGAVIFSTQNSNGTLTELPVIVDVDGDNHADIIVSANQLGIVPFGQAGIRVFQDQNNSWVNTRRIWNQHSYHITNINDNGTVPRIEQNSWQVHNTYRLNARPGISATTVADPTASYLRVQDHGGVQPSTFTVRVGNGGGLGVDLGVRVAFYNGQPGAGGVLLGVGQTTQSLDQGVYEDVSISFAQSLAGISTLVAVVDDDGTGKSKVTDFDRTNNAVSLALSALPGSFSIQVGTDQPSYKANAGVAINASVANAGSFDGTATVRFTIETADGMAAVTTINPQVTLGMPHGTSQSAPSTWNTGTIFTGNYRVKAELVDSAGLPYAAAFAPFVITTDTSTLVSGRITADKLSYLPSQTVGLLSRVTNLTENQPLDNVAVVTTVTNPDGSVRFTQSEVILQLMPSALKDFNYALPLGFAAPGSYTASLSLRNALGAVLAISTTSFTVLSSAATGSGLTGTLSGTPKPVPFGDPISLDAAVSNLGNADIPTLNVKISIVDPAVQQVLTEFPATLVVARTQTAPLSFGWPARAAVGGTYVAVLTATVGTATLTLAQENFTVAPPVTRVTGTLAAIPKQVPQGNPVTLNLAVTSVSFGAITGLPLSVTIVNTATQQVVAQFTDSANIALSGAYQKALSWPATGAVGTGYTATLRATIGGVAQTLAQDSFSIIAPPVQLDVALTSLKQARVLALLACKYRDDDGDDHDYDHDSERSDPAKQACVTQKSAFLASYLTGLGVTSRITTTYDDFTRAFRSGQYNTYWITGGGMKLDNDLTEEVREAVFRGDALILDAVHDERNHGLDTVAGTNVHGKLSLPNQAISVSGPIFEPGTLGSFGRPLQFDLTTGAAQAVFAASPTRPAIVTNQYGLGRGILFAYDLVDTLMAQPSSGLDDLVSAGIAWVAPAPAAVSEARSYTVLRARITNLSIGANLIATFTSPAGATVLGTAPAAQPDAIGRPVWSFALDSGATKNLDIGLRLPAATGTFSASLSVDLSTGLPSPLTSFTTLAVESADKVAPRVVSELSALTVSSNDKSDRDHAVASIRAAQASLAVGAYYKAIDQLVDASGWLLKITSADVSAQRVEVDRLLQEAQVRWFLAQPQ
jgi:hypothetical protein